MDLLYPCPMPSVQPSLLRRLRPALRGLLAVAMMGIGVAHFLVPEPFVRIVPAWLPAPKSSPPARQCGSRSVAHSKAA